PDDEGLAPHGLASVVEPERDRCFVLAGRCFEIDANRRVPALASTRERDTLLAPFDVHGLDARLVRDLELHRLPLQNGETRGNQRQHGHGQRRCNALSGGRPGSGVRAATRRNRTICSATRCARGSRRSAPSAARTGDPPPPPHITAAPAAPCCPSTRS